MDGLLAAACADGEGDGVRAGVGVGVEDGLAQGTWAGIGGGGDGVGDGVGNGRYPPQPAQRQQDYYQTPHTISFTHHDVSSYSSCFLVVKMKPTHPEWQTPAAPPYAGLPG